MDKNKQLTINMISSLLTYVVTFGISFFISPYIIETIGTDAYGFIGLANNFISYASLISIALNSMASRFITIKIHQQKIDEANRYFSSVFYANSIITAVLLVLFSLMFIFLENIINIPSNIFWDVKILFGILFANCLINQIGSVYGVATFATNKLYLSSFRLLEAEGIRIVVIVSLFLLFTPKISFMGVSTIICTIYVLLHNIRYCKKLLPDIRISRKNFDFKTIKELLSAGVWNLLTRLGQILQDGLDLLITNLFINPVSMGILSLAKTVPTAINGIVGSMVGSFSPNFTQLYAEGKNEELVSSVKQSIKIMGVISNLPIIVLLVCGKEFFGLWQPTQDAQQLHILSILACACLIISGGINCIYNIFTVVNKIKINSLMLLITGFLSVGVVFVLLNFTDLGIYAIPGTSMVLSILRVLLFTVPYGAHCLGQKWYSLYVPVLKAAVFVAISCLLGYGIKTFISLGGWLGLFVMAALVLAVSCAVGLFIMLNKNDREYLFSKFKRGKNK